jgi:hypothetical protein
MAREAITPRLTSFLDEGFPPVLNGYSFMPCIQVDIMKTKPIFTACPHSSFEMSIEEKMLESLQCKLGRIDGGEREMR